MEFPSVVAVLLWDSDLILGVEELDLGPNPKKYRRFLVSFGRLETEL